MIAVGHRTGIAGSNSPWCGRILALSFALVFALIASLDRPDSGVMTDSQRPLTDLHDAMTAATGSAASD